jgi:hypothetical protein
MVNDAVQTLKTGFYGIFYFQNRFYESTPLIISLKTEQKKAATVEQ